MAKKDDAPTLEMNVENMTLVPATPYEQEVLDSYRNGARVTVSLNQPKDPRLMRKFHAVLNLVMKHCDVPFKTIDQGKKMLKIELGFVHIGTRFDGKHFLEPISMREMDQQDLEDFVRGSFDVLHTLTGVDPETLNNESASVGPDTAEEAPSSDEQQQEFPEHLRGMDDKDLISDVTVALAGAASTPEILKTQGQGMRIYTQAMSDEGRAVARKIYEEFMKLFDPKNPAKRGDTVKYVAALSKMPEEEILKWMP